LRQRVQSVEAAKASAAAATVIEVDMSRARIKALSEEIVKLRIESAETAAAVAAATPRKPRGADQNQDADLEIGELPDDPDDNAKESKRAHSPLRAYRSQLQGLRPLGIAYLTSLHLWVFFRQCS
jgi:hypothetical protein